MKAGDADVGIKRRGNQLEGPDKSTSVRAHGIPISIEIGPSQGRNGNRGR
jgi:hypothetical protein